jgi:uracil-DNA glycosylase
MVIPVSQSPTPGLHATSPLAVAQEQIVTCERCRRLREYCQRIATIKKVAHRDDVYWGRPVPGFGDPLARVLILGLARSARRQSHRPRVHR